MKVKLVAETFQISCFTENLRDVCSRKELNNINEVVGASHGTKKFKMKLGGEVNHQTWNVVGISINLFVASMTELDGLSYDGFLSISEEI